MTTHLKKISKIAKKHGFFLNRTNKHAVWTNKAGRNVVTPHSGCCRRDLLNIEKQFMKVAAATA